MTYNLSSTGDTHYTTAIAAGAAEEEEYPGLRGDGIGFIHSVGVRSKENLDWAVEIWDGDNNVISVIPLPFDTTGITSGAYYFYSVSNLEIHIPQTSPKETVSVALRNNSDTAKTAGTDGEAVVLISIVK